MAITNADFAALQANHENKQWEEDPRYYLYHRTELLSFLVNAQTEEQIEFARKALRTVSQSPIGLEIETKLSKRDKDSTDLEHKYFKANKLYADAKDTIQKIGKEFIVAKSAFDKKQEADHVRADASTPALFANTLRSISSETEIGIKDRAGKVETISLHDYSKNMLKEAERLPIERATLEDGPTV